ncbi:hypothetical protein QTG54_001678 [Skeletonema marinoi]|uniref:Uncharacterized protein n=1 Tax=Skeletonema marinoi TaxID=267567 RepID=A0AAD8YLU7_9STRA|nr:hypothetical protein QTG54_001678 [Skeletonema marinoi]
MIGVSDSNSSSKSFTNKFQSIKKRAHDKIDNIRAVTSRRVNLAAKTQFLREEMSTLLRRKDIVGYGPDRPRVAVVVVVPQPSNGNNVGRRAKGGGGEGDEESRILKGALDAVQSVFLTTDRNRIFIVTVVMDGRGKVGTFEAKLDDIDAGRTMHRHGGEVHTHDHRHELEGEQKKEKGIIIPKRFIHFTTMKGWGCLRPGKRLFTSSMSFRGNMSKQGSSLLKKI